MVHENESFTNCTCIRSNKGIQDLVTIPLCIVPLSRTWRLVRTSMDTPPHTIADPRKQTFHSNYCSAWCYTRRSILLDVSILTHVYHHHKPVICFHLYRERFASVEAANVVFLRKLQMSSAVCCSEFWTSGRSSAPQTRFVQPIANCLITNTNIWRVLAIDHVADMPCSGDNDHDTHTVMALPRPCPGLLLYLPVSWNRIHSRATMLRLTPSFSATVLWVAPSSSICTALVASSSFK